MKGRSVHQDQLKLSEQYWQEGQTNSSMVPKTIEQDTKFMKITENN